MEISGKTPKGIVFVVEAGKNIIESNFHIESEKSIASPKAKSRITSCLSFTIKIFRVHNANYITMITELERNCYQRLYTWQNS